MWISKKKFLDMNEQLLGAQADLILSEAKVKRLMVELETAKKWTRQRDPKTGLFVKRSNSYQSETAKF